MTQHKASLSMSPVDPLLYLFAYGDSFFSLHRQTAAAGVSSCRMSYTPTALLPAVSELCKSVMKEVHYIVTGTRGGGCVRASACVCAAAPTSYFNHLLLNYCLAARLCLLVIRIRY